MASLRGPHLIPNNPNDSKATKTKMKGYPSGSGEKKRARTRKERKKWEVEQIITNIYKVK